MSLFVSIFQVENCRKFFSVRTVTKVPYEQWQLHRSYGNTSSFNGRKWHLSSNHNGNQGQINGNKKGYPQKVQIEQN